MKRLCIYHIFNQYNEVYEYVIHAIVHLHMFSDKVVVVCNVNPHNTFQSDILRKYADDIYCRDNIGYDAGGIKDAICDYIGWDEINTYDELLITNDTYFGPIHSFQNMFETMSDIQVDYWGLVKYKTNIVREHVQSYFLNVKSKMLHSADFREFWDNIEYPESYYDAIRNYELYFADYFESRGYSSTGWNLQISDLSEKVWESNPTLKCPDELILKYGFPILKRKAFRLANLHKIHRLLDELDKNDFYQVDMIEDYFKGNPDGVVYPFDRNHLKSFISRYKRIYLYGNGSNCEGMREYFAYCKVNYEAVLVTKKRANESNTIEFHRDLINEDDGIIVTVSKMPYYREIVELLLHSGIKESQLCLPMLNDDESSAIWENAIKST